MNTYRIDEEMMGPEWRGGAAELIAFAAILTKQTGKPVKAEVEFRNGAYDRNVPEDAPDITEEEWNAAIDATPDVWWR